MPRKSRQHVVRRRPSRSDPIRRSTRDGRTALRHNRLWRVRRRVRVRDDAARRRERQTRRMREALFRSIMRQEMAWFQTNDSGQLATRLTEYFIIYPPRDVIYLLLVISIRSVVALGIRLEFFSCGRLCSSADSPSVLYPNGVCRSSSWD